MLQHHVFDSCCFHHIDHMMIKFDDYIYIYMDILLQFSVCVRELLL